MRLFLAMLALAGSTALAENWPQWRGPDGNGISTETGVPVRWGPETNVAWKVPLEGWGTSTPVVWDDRVFLTTQVGDGPINGSDFEGAQAAERGDGAGGARFYLKAFARSDGRLLWESVFEADRSELPVVHVKHNLASPSCVTDGERVYAWFGTGLAAAFTLDGKELWRRHLGQENSRFDVRWGHGSSPTLYNDSLLLLVDHPHDSYLLAVDKRSGKDLWKAERGEGKRSYTTPYVVRREEGDQLLVNTNVGLEALDAATGETLWSTGEENRVPVGVPVVHNEVIYTNRGHHSSPYMALRTDNAGEVSWRVGTGGPYVSSLLYYQGLIYMATERGIASAVDAETGETVWKQRLGGVFSASPIAAGGRVYFVEESGKTYVVKAARQFEIVAENDLGERSLASPAVSDGRLLLRTDDHLWAIKQ